MIKIVAIVLFLSYMLGALEWTKDLDTALAKAEKEHKHIMVLVEGQYCRWCKKMEERTLGDIRVTKRLENYIVVKVMREDAKPMTKLPPVNGVPTIFFLKENREMLIDVVGYFDVQDFISYIDDVEQKKK